MQRKRWQGDVLLNNVRESHEPPATIPNCHILRDKGFGLMTALAPDSRRKSKPPITGFLVLQWLSIACFGMCLVLSINAVKLSAGPLPARTLFLFASLGALVLSDPSKLSQGITRGLRVLLIIVLAAVLGIGVSAFGGTPPAKIVQQVVEIHVQAGLSLVVSYALILRFGLRTVLLVFLGAFGVSGIVALFQALGIDAAWGARAFIGRVTGDPPITAEFYLEKSRAMGLSFTPALFATQACLAMAAILCWRTYEAAGMNGAAKRSALDPLVFGGMVIIAIMCIATGNRSPILGLVFFVAAYTAFKAPKTMLLALPILLMVGLAAGPIMDMLANSGVRVARTGDGSSEGRSTLMQYGLFLVSQRPLGYGLDFDSTIYWAQYANAAIYDPNPNAIRQWALHNYYVITLCKYGIFILALIPFIIPRTRTGWFLLIGYVPYMIHIFFHNDGPLQADFLFFFLIAAFMYCTSEIESKRADTQTIPRGQRWRRAFGSGAA